MKTYQLIAALVLIDIKRMESEGQRGFEEAKRRAGALLEGQSTHIAALLTVAEILRDKEKSS